MVRAARAAEIDCLDARPSRAGLAAAIQDGAASG